MDSKPPFEKTEDDQAGHEHDEPGQFTNIIKHPQPKHYEGLEREPLEDFEQEILERIVSGDMEPEVDEDEPTSSTAG